MIALLLSVALAEDCTRIGRSDILDVEPPAVIVLGERHAFQPDLRRAGSVVKKLAAFHDVTLALEAVHGDYQSVLDEYAEGKMDPDDLPELMKWQENWGFPWEPYEPLVTAALWDVDVVAAGLELGQKPEEVTIPVPTGYMSVLADAMAGHEMPLEMESRFVASMAWRDYSIAKAGFDAWDGEGYLIIVTGRGHVEGGKGVQWQAQRMTDKQVHSFVLAWADPPCYPGDQVWKPSLWESLGFQ